MYRNLGRATLLANKKQNYINKCEMKPEEK